MHLHLLLNANKSLICFQGQIYAAFNRDMKKGAGCKGFPFNMGPLFPRCSKCTFHK